MATPKTNSWLDRRHPLLTTLLILTCLLGACSFCTGCSNLQTGMADLWGNPKTGEFGATVEGATGDFHKNTGLNLSSGDNSLAALLIAGGLGVLAVSSYPIQRALRLRKERKWTQRLVDAARRKAASKPTSSGHPLA